MAMMRLADEGKLMAETAYHRVRKYVDYPYNQSDHLVLDSALVKVSSSDLRELVDRIEGLEADLEAAVKTAFERGATEWTRQNYPVLSERFSATKMEGGGSRWQG